MAWGISGLDAKDLRIVEAFYGELAREAVAAVAIVALSATVWCLWRSRHRRRLLFAALPSPSAKRPLVSPEPTGRRFLRISFGLLWVFDGLLQAQPLMPLDMARQVVEPAAASSPPWVQQLDRVLVTIWDQHPPTVPTAAVWAQVGIGLWLLAVPRGKWSRLAGAASAAWGLGVWVFGEAFGGIFAPGLTFLSGAPGAAVIYCVAGALLAMPDRSWDGPRLGRRLLRWTGLFWVGMALLQAWPGRGFWQGQATPHAAPGALTSLVVQMAQTPQPHFLFASVAAFGSFDAAHGWGVNFFAVVALALTGAALSTAKPGALRLPLLAAGVLCLADWALVQDLGFWGGVGTDPNSMVPMVLLLTGGYLAVTRVSPPLSLTKPDGDEAPSPSLFAGDYRLGTVIPNEVTAPRVSARVRAPSLRKIASTWSSTMLTETTR